VQEQSRKDLVTARLPHLVAILKSACGFWLSPRHPQLSENHAHTFDPTRNFDTLLVHRSY
jgi:hypothetical protein